MDSFQDSNSVYLWDSGDSVCVEKEEEDWKEVYEDSGFTSTSMDRSSPASALTYLICAENLMNYSTRYLEIT